jgi:hypothetical protein
MIDVSYLKSLRAPKSLRTKWGTRRQAWLPQMAIKGRAEHQLAPRDPCQGALSAVLHDFRPYQRLCQRHHPNDYPASSRMTDRKPRLRCRLVSDSVERQIDMPLLPRPKALRQTRLLRHVGLSPPIPDRDRVMQTEDWGRIAIRYCRSTKSATSAIVPATTVQFWF